MNEFAVNGGKARWITSPILSKDDWDALKLGDEARQDELLRLALARNIDDLEKSLEEDTLAALAWLVSEGTLSFRLAVLRNKLDGEFHDKFGLFTDEAGNIVSFSGSYNESIQGLHNYESFKVFRSWIDSQHEFIDYDQQRFEKLWSNSDPNVRVLDIGESNKSKIVRLRAAGGNLKGFTGSKPVGKGVFLRSYQEKAIKNWLDNGGQGFFEMATGAGKTITALAAAERLRSQQNGRLALIITVPYQHLVNQWQREADRFGIKSMKAFKSRNSWLNDLNSNIVEYNGRYKNFFCVITTNDTFCSSHFQASISRLRGPSLLIADEAHHLGTELSQRSYPQNVPYRLALSATPDRWFDDRGTAALRQYFGKTVAEFSLKDAIGVSLTEYNYFPVLVHLNTEEIERYERISHEISKLMRMPDTDEREERIKHLLIKRSAILNNAENKLTVLSRLLDQHPVDQHALFYCSPEQISQVNILLGHEKGLIVHPFTNKESPEKRQQLLHDFATGRMQALTAIKCLDEGVDVPATKKAFLLASSSNPREFIQRRGRILRKSEGKNFAELYDLITVPPVTVGDLSSDLFLLERQILTKELSRLKEFADTASNKHTALETIWNLADKYQLKHML